LAIASCGNAAIAAATLAHRVGWPLQVYVPDTVTDVVADLLTRLGAQVTRCSRAPHGPSGDPAVFAFREAVAAGAIPFSVQGPENGLCLDGGRTLGWEMAEALIPPARVVLQVGGGAFAACVGWGLGSGIRLDTVQTEGGAPLARAWHRAGSLPTDELGRHWRELMTPWDSPHSLADGILDDETYDWQADIAVMRASGGHPIVVPEHNVVLAYEIASGTGIPVSPTGSAGLAGLLPTEAGRGVAPGERVAIVFSGVRR
jgi:threonine dehydratase